MVEENEAELSVSDDGELSFDDSLKEFLSEYGGEDDSFKCTLYKYGSKINGNKKSICGQWVDEFPCLNDIGLTYGSGRYCMMATFPGKKKADGTAIIRSYTFMINEYYDKLIAQREQNIKPVQNPMADTMQMFSAFVQMIQPLIQQRPVQDNSNIASLINPLIVENAKTTQTLVNSMMQSQFQMIDQFKQKQIEDLDNNYIDDEEDNDMENNDGILGQILPLVEQFAPMLLGDKTGTVAKMASGAIKKSVEFKELLKDKEAYKRLLSYLDDKYGNKDTDRVLKSLSLKR